jgi:hypothetical protein
MDGVMARWLFTAAFLMLMLAFRALGAWQGWMNFSPLPAFLLMSLVCFTGRERWVLPVLAWLVSDPLMNVLNGSPAFASSQWHVVLGVLACLVVVPWVKSSFTWQRAMMGSLASALLFYLVTNAICFMTMPELYERSWQGWFQAQWTGPVGLGPTWVFLRNACAANLLFCGLFLLAQRPFSAYMHAPTVSAVVR